MPFPNADDAHLADLDMKAGLVLTAVKSMVWSKKVDRYGRDCQRRAVRERLQDFADSVVEFASSLEDHDHDR